MIICSSLTVIIVKNHHNFSFFYVYFVALDSLILNQQLKIVYLLRGVRYFNFSDTLSEDQNFDIRRDLCVKKMI